MRFKLLIEIEGDLTVEDFTGLNDSISKLSTDVAKLISTSQQNNQTAIDSAKAAVDAVDATVVAATVPAPPPPPPPPAG